MREIFDCLDICELSTQDIDLCLITKDSCTHT